MDNLKVENIIISKQFENTENLKSFLKTVKEKNIKLNIVEEGKKIKIEELYLEVLWPNSKQVINHNKLNNNSLICKLIYKNFSMIFTGDIEKETEKILISKYQKNNKLRSNILKVAHHGSNSSSTKEFLNLVNPQIALIGVGANNKYGHPNNEILDRLKQLNCKIYRTDKMGEIKIYVDQNSKIRTNYYTKTN